MSGNTGPTIGQTWPGATTPMVTPSGMATPQWLRFLLSLYTNTGGATPINITEVNNTANGAATDAETALTEAEEALAAAAAGSDAQLAGLFDNNFRPVDQGPLWALMLSA